MNIAAMNKRWTGSVDQQNALPRNPNPLRKVAFGKRDAALAKMVVQNIRQTMPPVLLYWCPRLQLMLRDHHLHLQPIPLALQDDNITPAAHRHQAAPRATRPLL